MTARQSTPARAQERTDENRTSAERDEWRVAGELGSGLERARLALAVAVARQRHADAEGVAYV